jgi:hypothetical protein
MAPLGNALHEADDRANVALLSFEVPAIQPSSFA